MWKFAILGVVLAGPVRAQVTQRVSVATSGEQANGYSARASVSDDGRYVAFASQASNLDASDTNDFYDVFVRDRQAGTTECVSLGMSGAPGNGASSYYAFQMSADGRYVAFDSTSSNLVPGDTNGVDDVFVHDRLTGTTERVSVDSGGVEGNGPSGQYGVSISGDGRYVAFVSQATNLVAGDLNGYLDVFVRDRLLGTTERISVTIGGGDGNGPSGQYGVAISSDGLSVAFESRARNLVVGDTNGVSDIFVRDRSTGTTTRVSVDSAGAQGNAPSDQPSISEDGRYVAFDSGASNLVFGDTNGEEDVFVHDRQLGKTSLVSVDSTGTPGNGVSYFGSISSDGQHVAFLSWASNLVAGDRNGTEDVFVRDLVPGTNELVTVDSAGVPVCCQGWNPVVSADGRYVLFWSTANDFVPGDTNGYTDVFDRDRQGGTTFTSLCDPAVDGVIACPCSNAPGGPGRGCDNSAATGGARLAASGGTYLSSDSLVFTTSGEKPTATSVLLQGNAIVSSGVVYGQGVRCVGGLLRRLFTKTAAGGSIQVPDFGAGDPQVSVRSASKGDLIGAGQSRTYLVFYRDPTVLGGCPASSTFNATQTGRVDWSP